MPKGQAPSPKEKVMVSEVLTRNCKRCGTQYITTDQRKIFCTTVCSKRYSAMVGGLRKRRERPDHYERYDRERSLKKNYGITIAEYDQMFSSQSGKCAICETHQDNLSKRLAVDHCHTTGKLRKLLCEKCNRGLGFFQDSPVLLKKAMEYLL